LTLLGEDPATTIIDGGESASVISLSHCRDIAISNFTIQGSSREGPEASCSGIFIHYTGNSLVQNNFIRFNEWGVFLYDSSGNVLRNNQIADNKFNFGIVGLYLNHFVHDIDDSNKVNGRTVYYWVNQHNRVVPTDAGYLAAVNSSGIAVENLTLSDNEQGVLFAYTVNSTVLGVEVSNCKHGILLASSSNCEVVSCISTNNSWSGITMRYSESSSLRSNHVMNSDMGAILVNCMHNEITNNSFAGNKNGISLYDSQNNTISGNNITTNSLRGVSFQTSSWNSFYHNNFVDNKNQVSAENSMNFWDNDYPSGGNYWSDYNSTDLYSGSFQNEYGSDGIGDTGYVLDGQNRDRYPLKQPWSYGLQQKLFDVFDNENSYYSLAGTTTSIMTHFRFDTSTNRLRFTVIEEAAPTGYCVIAIPKVLLQPAGAETWKILLDNQSVAFTIESNNSYSFVGLSFSQGEHNVEIFVSPAQSDYYLIMLFVVSTAFLFYTVFFIHRKRRREKMKL
jgi:parallel beta-helix repeat protein